MTTEQNTGSDIIAVVRALRPGEDVLLMNGKDPVRDRNGKHLSVRVHEVKFQDLEQFAEDISVVLPKILEVVTSSLANTAKIEGIDKDSLLDTDVMSLLKMKGSVNLSRIVPIVSRHLANMIRACVEPRGVMEELPHDMAAPIVAKWVEMNLMSPGKLDAWVQALEGVMAQADEDTVKGVLGTVSPVSESSSPPSSSPDSA
jgi:hypothetical protein